MIDVTNCDLRMLVAKAYELSVPQGLGFLHFKPAPLTEEEIDEIIDRGRDSTVSMDYVNGRAVKLHVYRRDDKLFIADNWYDHYGDQLAELCDAIGAVVTS